MRHFIEFYSTKEAWLSIWNEIATPTGLIAFALGMMFASTLMMIGRLLEK